MRDFSLSKYAHLLDAVRDAELPASGLASYLAAPPPDRASRCALLRHDVEWGTGHALAMARLESGKGVRATYFFRIGCVRKDPDAIRAVAGLDHEVGYHYDVLARALGNRQRALDLFARDLEQLRRLAPVRVASMHGSPLLPWDNRDVWLERTPADFGLVGEAYRDLDFGAVAYFSDTGRTWHPTRHNVRDRGGALPPHAPETTDDLVALLRRRTFDRVCLLTHPERWPAGAAAWARQALVDHAANLAKALVSPLVVRSARP